MADKAYFQKFVVTSRVRLSNGKLVPWVNVGINTGVLETDDELTIKELTAYAKEGKGGVKVIDKAEFESVKKNFGPKLSRKQWQPTLTPPFPVGKKTSAEKPSEKPSDSVAVEDKPKQNAPSTAVGALPKPTPLV